MELFFKKDGDYYAFFDSRLLFGVWKWGREQGYLNKNCIKVNKSGDEYFKLINPFGLYRTWTDIGANWLHLTKKGYKLIEENFSDVMELKFDIDKLIPSMIMQN